MNDLEQARSQIVGLSELERGLWTSFGRAEREHLPPAFKPWAVLKACWTLHRAGKLKFYEWHPIYGVLAAACVAMTIVGRSLWFFFPYLVFLTLMFICHSRYVERFIFLRTQCLGLERFGFNVDYLPLLVIGTMTNYAGREAKSAKGGEPVAFTRENVASVIKLAKSGHEYSEIAFGASEVFRRSFLGGIAAAGAYAIANFAQMTAVVAKGLELASREYVFAALLVAFCGALVLMLHSWFFGEASAKRQRRRYLLVLNMIHEGWNALGIDVGEGSKLIPADVAERPAKRKTAPLRSRMSAQERSLRRSPLSGVVARRRRLPQTSARFQLE